MPLPAWNRKRDRGKESGTEANGWGAGEPTSEKGAADIVPQGNGTAGEGMVARPPGNGTKLSEPPIGEVGPIAQEAGFRVWAGERGRRFVNVMAAAGLLLLTLPIMMAVAVTVKLTSRGPVLFTQTRVGLNRRNGGAATVREQRSEDYGGRLFRLYKFRTMEHRAGKGGRDGEEERQVWAAPDDPRITPVGGVLRRTRLDELPQLWNVLRGDMNLVGPRPEQPDIARSLSREIEHYPWRHRVRPGITGWAQVNHPYDQSLEDVRRKVALDLEYMQRRSALEDLRIMARTVPVMLFRKGAR